jgi:hypothetical protein
MQSHFHIQFPWEMDGGRAQEWEIMICTPCPTTCLLNLSYAEVDHSCALLLSRSGLPGYSSLPTVLLVSEVADVFVRFTVKGGLQTSADTELGGEVMMSAGSGLFICIETTL